MRHADILEKGAHIKKRTTRRSDAQTIRKNGLEGEIKMAKLVYVRFHDAGKSYRFTCNDLNLTIGDAVMVETSVGLDLAHVVEEPYDIDDSQITEDVLPVLRMANEKEIERYSKEILTQLLEIFDKEAKGARGIRQVPILHHKARA